jgi:signal transduction histidine kinase
VRPDAQERGLRISLDAPGPATIQGHADSLRQALDNLLSNAHKYAPKGTEVLVRVAREGSSWVLSVRDEGPGIPPAERAAVFEPFHRVPGSKPGAGLGLTIVHEVARLHGGRALISDIPRGAEVRIELPAGDPPPPVDQKKK